ncbi:olfactory receptor 2B8-like [Eretmochelys imbricata]
MFTRVTILNQVLLLSSVLLLFWLCWWYGTVPSTPGRTHVLLLSSWRSGSTFAGQLFRQHPEVLHLMELAKHICHHLPRGSPELLQGPAWDLLHSLFRCEAATLQDFMLQACWMTQVFQHVDIERSVGWQACSQAWRHQLSFHQVQEICKTAMEVFVYGPVSSEEEWRDLMILGKGEREDGNQSSLGEFILLGVSDRPQFELLLFVLILTCYTMILLGNTTIIVVSWRDPHLHTPMYFFLSNLSFLDLCYTTSVGPQMLVNFRSTQKSISWAGCVAQLYISLSLGGTECLLLAVMAYDRYTAICQPLHYTIIMSRRLCLQLAATSWLCGFGNSILQTILTLQLPRCGRNQIEHFFCEVPALLKLACVDTSANEAELLASGVILLLVPLGLILVSYGYISTAVLRIHSAQGRLKAFNTCSSHLAVVSLFYGTAISTYLQPPSSYSQDRGKMVSLFYTMVTPMLNPLIYTLRNKEVHRALWRALGRNVTAQVT